MRQKVIAANWKMNMTPSKAEDIMKQLKSKIEKSHAEVVICVPSIDIVPVVSVVKDSNIHIGAENMHYEENGAYTGELSAEMLTDAGVSHVILGHSERREYFMESDMMINKKVRKALQYHITPIICCGETLKQRDAGETFDLIKYQITSAFVNVSATQAIKCIIAYEPIWAIGSGKVATAEQAQEVCLKIRSCISELYNEQVAYLIRIIYGGSVNAANAAELFTQPDIDGGLVGGASLKPEFEEIVNYK